MKNILSCTFILATIILFSTGCKKNSFEPESNLPFQDKYSEVKSIYKLSSSIFQVKEDYSSVGLSGTPLLTLTNPPIGSQQYIIFMEGRDSRKNSKVLWLATASGKLQQIDAQGFGSTSTQIEEGGLKNLITFYRAPKLSACTIEIFAINRELTIEETIKLKMMTRKEFKSYCMDTDNGIKLLGSSVAKSTEKATAEATSNIKIHIRSLERSIKNAEEAKRKIEEKFTSGTATANAVRLAEEKLTKLKNDMIKLQEELSRLQSVNTSRNHMTTLLH